jgi:CheY-like chemotaxis protein
MLSDKKILIVDYDNIRIGIISKNLKSAKAQCYAALDGETALDKCKTTAFNLIIINIEAPVLNGLTITKLIREQKSFLTNANVPIIGFSQYTRPHTEQQALQSGMNAYLQLNDIYTNSLLIQKIKDLETFSPVSNISFTTSFSSNLIESIESIESEELKQNDETHAVITTCPKKRCIIL